MLKFIDVEIWGSAPVGHVEIFVRLYVRGYVRVAHKARAGGDLVLLTADRMVPSSTPHLNWDSVIGQARRLSF